MRLARALAAAALTLGLAATLAPVQAAPQAAPVPPVVTAAPAAAKVAAKIAPSSAKVAKAKTRITVKVSKKKVKVGTTVTVSGKLTRNTGRGYKPYAKQKVVLIRLDRNIPILATTKTSKTGTYTFRVKTKTRMVGKVVALGTDFPGNSTSREAFSRFGAKVKVTK